MAKAKRNWRWVSRDNFRDANVDVWSTANKPHIDGENFLTKDGWVSTVCDDEFALLFGFVPDPGECIKVEFTARKIS